MSGIIKNISTLLLVSVCFCGCKHYAPFPDLDDGELKSDAENVAYDDAAPVIGNSGGTQTKTAVSPKTEEVKPVVQRIKEEKQVPEKEVAKNVKEEKQVSEKAAVKKIESAKVSKKDKSTESVETVIVKSGKYEDLAKPNPVVEDVASKENVFVVPGKTTPSVITDMDLVEMDGQDKKPRSKIIKPTFETRTIVPVKKEIKTVMPKKDATVEPSVFYLAETIYFNNGGASVDSQYYNSLRKIVKEAKAHNGKIVVQGFASSRTRNADVMTHKMANLKVSVARAENVADLLVKYGMPRSKVITEGLSDSRPVYLEVMPEGERLNRRAEIYISY